MAAPASPLAWHSRVPVEVFFHTGHHASTRVLASEFTRQLDRQLSALSLLSAERLLEGIRTYRTQGRQPTSKATRDSRKNFMKEVVDDLQRTYGFSESLAETRTAEVDRALVVLHESDQVTYGPSHPATTAEGWPSLGHGAVNSSIGGQQPPVAAVLEQAALAVPADRRPRVRLLVRAVLADSPDLAQDLRHGQVHLEPRTSEQVSATSPRGPPWTPAHVASTIAAGHPPWHPAPRGRSPVRTSPGPGSPTSQASPAPPPPSQAPHGRPPPQRGRPRRAPPRPGRASRATRSPARRSWPTSRPEWPRRPARATSPGPRGRHSPGPAPPAPPACARPPSPTRPPPPYEHHQHSSHPRQAPGRPGRAGRATRSPARRSWPTSRPEPPE
ncbi:polymorphic toxin type 15 domain-containing protein [Actinomyces lilanjuaniae]|uniref:polymorphic toxin type 15 domain-containing protein n=1 Tax=Actinomyces lilanjuaniae TaxID=2321394 RepID=UPI0013C4447C|nr:polymorphic toxin type 15 domain-containing protein [Actinomyces lilanjuaniae]